MTKQEAIEEMEEYLDDADKAISMDEEYISGWKSALLVALGIVSQIEKGDENEKRERMEGNCTGV